MPRLAILLLVLAVGVSAWVRRAPSSAQDRTGVPCEDAIGNWFSRGPEADYDGLTPYGWCGPRHWNTGGAPIETQTWRAIEDRMEEAAEAGASQHQRNVVEELRWMDRALAVADDAFAAAIRQGGSFEEARAASEAAYQKQIAPLLERRKREETPEVLAAREKAREDAREREHAEERRILLRQREEAAARQPTR